MDFIRMPDGKKATLWDRCQNAYYAFQMKVKPDVQRILEEIGKMQAKADEIETTLEDKRQLALNKLQPFEQSQVHSIAAQGENWREQYDQCSMFIEHLPIADQLTIMQYIFSGNRRVVTTLRFRQWMANHAEAILDNLPE